MVGFHIVVGGFGDGKNVWGHLETITPSIRIQHSISVDAQVSERVDRNQHMADVRVYLSMLEPFLQVVVYGFVGDLAQQSKIGYTDFLLLGNLKGSFLNLWLPVSSILLPTSK